MTCPACDAARALHEEAERRGDVSLPARVIFLMGFTCGTLGHVMAGLGDPSTLLTPREAMLKMVNAFCPGCQTELRRQAKDFLEDTTAQMKGTSS